MIITNYSHLNRSAILSNWNLFTEKWNAFNWHVQMVDGHDHNVIKQALYDARLVLDQPSVIICNNKGKGVSFMENQVLWHYRSPQNDEFELALKEVNAAIKEFLSDER